MTPAPITRCSPRSTSPISGRPTGAGAVDRHPERHTRPRSTAHHDDGELGLAFAGLPAAAAFDNAIQTYGSFAAARGTSDASIKRTSPGGPSTSAGTARRSVADRQRIAVSADCARSAPMGRGTSSWPPITTVSARRLTTAAPDGRAERHRQPPSGQRGAGPGHHLVVADTPGPARSPEPSPVIERLPDQSPGSPTALPVSGRSHDETSLAAPDFRGVIISTITRPAPLTRPSPAHAAGAKAGHHPVGQIVAGDRRFAEHHDVDMPPHGSSAGGRGVEYLGHRAACAKQSACRRSESGSSLVGYGNGPTPRIHSPATASLPRRVVGDQGGQPDTQVHVLAGAQLRARSHFSSCSNSFPDSGCPFAGGQLLDAHLRVACSRSASRMRCTKMPGRWTSSGWGVRRPRRPLGLNHGDPTSRRGLKFRAAA